MEMEVEVVFFSGLGYFFYRAEARMFAGLAGNYTCGPVTRLRILCGNH